MPLNESDISIRVNDIICGMLGCSDLEILPQMMIKNDLGINSFAMLQFIAMLEEEFEIDVPKIEIINIITVEDIYNYLKTSKGV